MIRSSQLNFSTIVSISVFILLAFTSTSYGQKADGLWLPPVSTRVITPHDFNNDYYLTHGVTPKGIFYRRTGEDRLSVPDESRVGRKYNNIRVLVTVPAYDENGGMLYWYPLGDPYTDFFTDDKAGVIAMETAKLFPMYIFPGPIIEKEPYSFANNRHAPVIDNTWAFITKTDLNPLGLRQVFFVNYTEAAFTKENAWIMEELAKRNGLATDDTPIIKTVSDLNMLFKYEMITTNIGKTDVVHRDWFAIAPIIIDPTKGVLAKDAFIWMAEKDGECLPTEEIFETHFDCLKNTGGWCYQ